MLTLIVALAALLLAFEARRAGAGVAVWAGGMAIVALWLGLHNLVRVAYDGRHLHYQTPWQLLLLERGQIAEVRWSGRFVSRLLVGYHPRERSGRIAMEQLRFLHLVPLRGQDELYALLGGRDEEG
ncbi:MAG: hypothetical protein N2383_12515 [Caldilineales bacterium]|nr:hypothetical protein [Caldilineales bacterium]